MLLSKGSQESTSCENSTYLQRNQDLFCISVRSSRHDVQSASDLGALSAASRLTSEGCSICGAHCVSDNPAQ